jgi:hypothetical protein
MPQSLPLPLGLRKALIDADAVGEDGGGEALLDVVVHRDRLVEMSRVGEDVEDRREGLFAEIGRWLLAGTRMMVGSTKWPARPRASPARLPPTQDSVPALGLRLGDGVVESLDGAGVDERADERALGEGIADADGAVRRDEAREERVGDAFVDDQAAGGGAALAGGADGGEDDGRRARSRSASGDDDGVVAAQFEEVRPKRCATTCADALAHAAGAGREISGTRLSATRRSPTTSSVPITRRKTPGWPIAVGDRSAIALLAMAVSGAMRLGFQRMVSPQTAASIAFHAQTALGKLKAVMTPMGPSGCHCSEHAVAWALAGHGDAVELAREADGEVGDVDRLLHLAEALGADLADLERDERAERVLGAELVADGADDLAAHGRGDLKDSAPGGRVVELDPGERLAGRGVFGHGETPLAWDH